MRLSGILMHLSSLPNRYGIGTMGKSAYQFVDFLKNSNQSYWQVLPIGPTSFGDSPYQSFSSFAGNPYFIDYEILEIEGLLKQEDYQEYQTFDNKIDYQKLYLTRYLVLRIAYNNFIKNPDSQFYLFCQEHDNWLDDYATFMAIKKSLNELSWWLWPDQLKKRDQLALTNIKEELKAEINFWKFIQYCFYQQWNNLKTYASKAGIKIIGDLPIYVALDSADVWSNPQLWLLDKNYYPLKVAGCPPDYFSPDGQLWGNPIYDYQKMKKNGYQWWINRIKGAFSLYDVVRIDHFRGFSGYYAIDIIPDTIPDAKNGRWYQGPGYSLFKAVKKQLGELAIIAEDLGFLTEDVHQLRKKTNFPGMKILQFAFDPYQDNDYLPHNITNDCVVYPGTHDNQTLLSWYQGLSSDVKGYVDNYLGIKHPQEAVYKVIRTALATSAKLVIIALQDYLELDDQARMNTPSTVGINWSWQLDPQLLTNQLSQRIADLVKVYKRI